LVLRLRLDVDALVVVLGVGDDRQVEPLPIGSRVIFPSVVNTILYLMFVVAAVNGCPVKNVAWISAGASAAAELGCVPMRVTVAANNKARISDSP